MSLSVPVTILPVAPMRRAQVDPLLGLRIEPTAKRSPARKAKRMNCAIGVDDRKVKVAVPRSAYNRLPVHPESDGSGIGGPFRGSLGANHDQGPMRVLWGGGRARSEFIGSAG
jgi:hypothetical protein